MELARTHMYKFHEKHGSLIDFAGFNMPIWYDAIIPEHLAVRNGVGIFDVTHMGRCTVDGKDATLFLNYILTRDVASSNINQGRYTVICNAKGGIVDDEVVFRLDKERFLIIYNASNRKKDYDFIIDHAQDFDVKVKDVSDEVVMFSVQGPKTVDTLQSITDIDLSTFRYYWGDWATIDNLRVFITRTGYTGEDGFEIFLWDTPLDEIERAEKLWQSILNAGQKYNIKPCGLGARDTLRLEAGMCLYGNDISEDTTPLEAGLDWIIQFEKDDFIGKEALTRQKADGIKRTLVGIRALDKGVPRAGNKILFKGEEVGILSSGTFSPLLKYGIGLGYVPLECAQTGTNIDILIRERSIRAEVTETPFYNVKKYGRKRNV